MRIFLTLILSVFSLIVNAQTHEKTVSGFVLDESNQPIPFAGVYIKQTEDGVVTDENGRYFFLLPEGYYDLVVSYMGYETQTIVIVVQDKDIQQNFHLKTSLKALDLVTVTTSKKKDPAYGIMKEVIKNKNKFKTALSSYTCQVYFKGKSQAETKYKRPKSDKRLEYFIEDSLRRDSIRQANNMPDPINLCETKMTLHYTYPNKFKEIKHADTKRGSMHRIYQPKPGPSAFNFYQNLIETKLSETPLVSPTANSAFLSYKFKLLESYIENDQLLHKIQVIPRGMGNALFDGEIVVVQNKWNIHAVHLNLPKHLVSGYDEMAVEQEFEIKDDSIVLIKRESFDYLERYGKTKHYGNTSIYYSDYTLNPTFAKRYFNDEVRFVEAKAYERDSSYWKIERPEPLSLEEQAYVRYTDSVAAEHKKESYLDSMDRETNQIRLINLLWSGQGHVNRDRKEVWFFGSLPGLIEPIAIGGTRLAYWITYYREWENKRNLFIAPRYSYGLRNDDHNYNIYSRYEYDPMHFGRLFLFARNDFEVINQNGNLINYAQRSNYFEAHVTSLAHYRELFNGIGHFISFEYGNRKPITELEFGTLTDQIFQDNQPRYFDRHNYTLMFNYISFTPGLKFIREPYRKVNLGSEWPTLTIEHQKAIPGIGGSSIDYDYLELRLWDRVNFKTLGSSVYSVKSGKFFRMDSLTIVDYKYQREALPYVFYEPNDNFQLLQQGFPTFDWFIEAHWNHHFNGVIVNKFPLLKKLGLKATIGASTLYAFENDYMHAEAYAGFEKDFKIFKERLRYGIYYAFGGSNQIPGLIGELKMSFKHFDRSKQRFEF